MTAIHAKRDVASALRIATSAKAFGKNEQYTQGYAPSRRRYPAKIAVDDDQGDDDEEGNEGDEEGD